MKLANSLFCGRETEVTRQRRSEALSSGWCDKVISRSDPGGNWALAQRVHFSERAYFFWRPNDIKVCDFSQQSGRNFGERMLGISLTKIMAAIFYFNGSERLGREMNLYQGRDRRSKIGRGAGEWRLNLSEVIVILQNSIRPRTEVLIGAVKLQLSITSQMCHLSVILTFRPCGRERKMANSDCEVISFDSIVGFHFSEI